MGTPHISTPSLQALIDNGHEVLLTVTREDKPKGRGGDIAISPVKELSLKYGIPIYQPNKLRGNDEAVEVLSSYNADFFVVVAYGRILPIEVLEIPKVAPINVHFSLLPKYRGSAPVNWAIVNGERDSGVSTMLMDAGLDTGDILLTKSTPILRKNSHELADELAISGAELLIETLNNFDTIKAIKQDDSLATLAPIIKKEDGLINFNDSAIDIERKVRGFYGWPSTYTSLAGKVLKINRADVVEQSGSVGEIIAIDKESFTIACGEGSLKILNLQLEGKRAMDTAQFLSGYRLSIGDRVG